ncbi:MAG: hypothetical protein V1859_03025 [archaeon]
MAANNELIEYIKKVKEIGHSDESIVNHLKKHGYTDKHIDDAYKSLNKKFDALIIVMVMLIVCAVLLLVVSLGIKIIGSLNLGEPPVECEPVQIKNVRREIQVAQA